MLRVYCPERVFKRYSAVNVANIRYNCFIRMPTVHTRVYSALLAAITLISVELCENYATISCIVLLLVSQFNLFTSFNGLKMNHTHLCLSKLSVLCTLTDCGFDFLGDFFLATLESICII